MKTLIIGAAGMVGRKLTENLLSQANQNTHLSELILYDIIKVNQPNSSVPIKILSGDISKPHEAKILSKEKPSIIYHLASIVSGEFVRRIKKN